MSASASTEAGTQKISAEKQGVCVCLVSAELIKSWKPVLLVGMGQEQNFPLSKTALSLQIFVKKRTDMRKRLRPLEQCSGV